MRITSRNWLSIVAQSWLDSLKIFLPKNFKLFFLASLNAARYAFIPVLILMVLTGGLLFTYVFFGYPAMVKQFTLLRSTAWPWFVYIIRFVIEYIPQVLIAFSIAGVVLFVRPAVHLKNFSYLWNKKIDIVYAICAVLLFFFVWIQLVNYSKFDLIQILGIFGQFTVLFLHFLFDQRASFGNVLKSLGRTILFYLYNLPFLTLLFALCLLTFDGVGAILSRGLPEIAGRVNLIVLLPLISFFFICMLSIFYTKRVHEQYELYF